VTAKYNWIACQSDFFTYLQLIQSNMGPNTHKPRSDPNFKIENGRNGEERV